MGRKETNLKGGENMKSKIIGAISGIAGALTLAMPAFAQTPAPFEMDADLQANVLNIVTSFVGVALGLIVLVIVAVGGYYISVRAVHLILRWAHRFGA